MKPSTGFPAGAADVGGWGLDQRHRCPRAGSVRNPDTGRKKQAGEHNNESLWRNSPGSLLEM